MRYIVCNLTLHSKVLNTITVLYFTSDDLARWFHRPINAHGTGITPRDPARVRLIECRGSVSDQADRWGDGPFAWVFKPADSSSLRKVQCATTGRSAPST